MAYQIQILIELRGMGWYVVLRGVTHGPYTTLTRASNAVTDLVMGNVIADVQQMRKENGDA